MAIFMKVTGIDGESTVKGQEGCIELTSLEWHATRSIEGGRAGGQAIADVKVGQVRVTKSADASSAQLIRMLLMNDVDRKIEIRFVRTDSDKPGKYAFFEMENCGITDYAITSHGSTPNESLLINFEKIFFKVFKTGDDLKGVPDSVGYTVPSGRG